MVWPFDRNGDYWNNVRMALADATVGPDLSIALGETTTAVSQGDFKGVFGFQTPKGRRGLLQIVGFSDPAHGLGVKVHYKFVQDGARPTEGLIPGGVK